MNEIPAINPTLSIATNHQDQQTPQTKQIQPQKQPSSRPGPGSGPQGLPTRQQAQQMQSHEKSESGLPPAEASNSEPANESDRANNQTQGPRNHVLDKDKNTIDYLTSRALNGKEVSKEDVLRIQSTNEAMDKTRASIPSQGNVSQEVEKTKGLNVIKNGVARNFSDIANTKDSKNLAIAQEASTRANWPFKGQLLDQAQKDRESIHNTDVAYAIKAGTGNCHEIGALTARNLTKNLPQGEQAKFVDSKDAGHLWATREGDGKKTVVADAWMSGGAAFIDDSHGVHGEPTDTLEAFVKGDNSRLVKDSKKKMDAISDTFLKKIDNISGLAVTESVVPSNLNFFNNSKTTSPKFREDARVAAKLVNEIAGPREEHKAVVVGGSDPERITAAQSVNDMIPNIASGLNLTEAAAAEHIANKVSQDALRPQSPPPSEKDAWLGDGKSVAAPNSQAGTKTNRSGT
jgi:hypothetical protein